ncbi:bola-like protein-domain-containing protein [Mrakia frigida]|uniref:Bol1p n=1 Tax=Mrakia frigida TaxID=29902 RepID=UPI003FCC04D2
MSSASASDQLPSMEESIRTKLEALLEPTLFQIRNDSSKHSHHQPMLVPGAFTGETHFYLHIRSPLFAAKTRVARHRLVNAALTDEFARGLHALSLKLETEEEADKAEGGK